MSVFVLYAVWFCFDDIFGSFAKPVCPRRDMVILDGSQLLFCMGLAARSISDEVVTAEDGVQGSSEPSGARFCCRICSQCLANDAAETAQAAAELAAAAAEYDAEL